MQPNLRIYFILFTMVVNANSSSPLVSVILPVRNAETTLHQCFSSISSQSLKNFELIIINDGSQDGSVELIKRWMRRDKRFRLLNQPTLGLVVALNQGIKLARGDYIARMDADDVMYSSRLQDQHQFLKKNSHIGLVASQVKVFPKERLTDGFSEYIRWQNNCLNCDDIADEIYVESPLAHPTVMFRRCLINKLGGYRHGDFPEDYDLWLRMSQSGVKMAKLPQVLLDWRDDHSRTSRTDPRYSRQAFDQLRADFLAEDPRINTHRPLVYWGAGRKTRKRANLLIAKGYKPTAWIDIDPRKIGNKILNAPVVAPAWLEQKSKTGNKPFILGYVANHGARDIIAAALHKLNYKRGIDYLMVG